MILQFITAATPYIGRGHVYRTIALAQEMKKRGHKCRIDVASRTVGQKVIESISFPLYGCYLSEEIECIILDVPGPHHYIHTDWKAVYLDWTGDEQYDGAAVDGCVLKICQGVPFRQPERDNEKVGFEYAILWPDVVDYRGTARKEQIFFYSSQQNSLTERVLDLFKNLNIPIVQPQPGVKRAIEDLASSAVAITFGGMTCLEACCLGIPQVAISTGPKHEFQINALVRTGAIWGVNENGIAFIPGYVTTMFDSWKSTSSSSLYQDMSAAGMRCINGRGVYCVADVIESLV